MPEWTERQKHAIEARGRSVIVSAAAGSGKTAVLVERLLRILSDYQHPVRADRIIVVTFTNAAAAEMKQRLAKALNDRLAELEESEEYEWLTAQRMYLSSARISTVHAFCFDLIRENADVLDVLPSFGIADTGQTAICQRKALDTVMERWMADPDKQTETQLLFNSFCTDNDTRLEKLVTTVAEYLESVAFPDQWLAKARAFADDCNSLYTCMYDAICNIMEECIAIYQRAECFAKSAQPDVTPAENKFCQRLTTELHALQSMRAELAAADMETVCSGKLSNRFQFTAFYPPRKDVEKESKECFRQLRELCKDRYAKVTELLDVLRFFRKDAALLQKLIPPLLDLVELYCEEFRREKQARNLLSFADAEELTLQLLADRTPEGSIAKSELARSLSAQYDLIMVDEYQDTNNKQDSIFKLLSNGTRIDDTGLHYGDNTFLVGDVKQAIYSFRQANPENFRSAISESVPYAPEGREMALIRLEQNFRSAPGVLNFVNALFTVVMHLDCGEVEYTKDEQLVLGSRLYQNFTGKACVLLTRDEPEIPAICDAQAECVADTIAEMIGKALVLVPGEDDSVTTRTAQAGDFCILLRDMKNAASVFKEALHRRGIGVSARADSDLLELPEIRLVHCILRIADNPMTDTAMAAVMLSAVGGFTAEELAKLKLFGGGQHRRLYRQMTALADEKQPAQELETLQIKVQKFLSLLRDMQEALLRYPLEEAIWEIYGQTDLLALQSIYDDAEQRRSRLDIFAQLAGDYSRFADLTAQSCLSGGLRYLDRLQDSEKKLECKSGAVVQGCVQLLTIHGSKGLEFPFVFCANLDNRFKKNESKASILLSEDGMTGLKIYDRNTCLQYRTNAFPYLVNQQQNRQTSEELRLLYVALTRAKQQLFLVLHNPESTNAYSAGKLACLLHEMPEMAVTFARYATSMQDWILHFLLSGKDRQHMADLLEGKESSGLYAEYRQWHYNPVEPAEPMVHTSVPDAAQMAAIRRNLSFTYVTPQSELISKNSVTQLAHPEDGVLDQLHDPQFSLESQNGTVPVLKGTARGTAVHKLMQLMDFSLGAQDPKKALDALLAAGAVTESECACITPEHLEAFFASPLYRRIAAADRVERERKIFVELGTLKLPSHPELVELYRGTDSTMIGTMDLIFHEPDGWVILDYKTDYEKADGEEELKRKYALQMQLYRSAAELIFAEPVKALYLYSFSLDKAIEIDPIS